MIPPRRLALALGILILACSSACAANPDALWQIVHGKCAPNLAHDGTPAPCVRVAYPGGETSGYAVLKDLRGASQFLLIPTARLGGIEDPAILLPNITNYWQAAWRVREDVFGKLGRALSRDAISLAINSPYGRSQTQLHIHVDCVRADIRDELNRQLPAITTSWAPLSRLLAGHPYRARRVMGAELEGTDPFALLAADAEVGAANLGSHTLVLVGAVFANDQPGFVLLDDRVNLAGGDFASGEELQDHDCMLARSLPN